LNLQPVAGLYPLAGFSGYQDACRILGVVLGLLRFAVQENDGAKIELFAAHDQLLNAKPGSPLSARNQKKWFK
jgi:hypothetical protein